MPTFTDADYSEKNGLADYNGNDQGVNGQEEDDDEQEIAVLPLAVLGQEMPFVPSNNEQDNNNNNNNNKEEGTEERQEKYDYKDGAMEERTARASSFHDASNSTSVVPFSAYSERPSSNDKEIDVDDYASYARYARQCHQITGGTTSLIGCANDGAASACTLFTSEGHGNITKVIDVDEYAAYAKNQHHGVHFTGDDDEEIVVDGQDERQSLLLEARLMSALEARLEARLQAKIHEQVASILRTELTAMDPSLGDWNGHTTNPLHGSFSGRPHPASSKDVSTEETKREQKRLTEDTFSFFITSKATSKPFLLAVMVAGLQLAVFCLAAVGLIDLGSPNPLNIPSDVDPNVRTLQFLLVIVAVIFTKDLIVVFDIAKEGFSRVIYNSFQYATKWKFFLSLAMRTLQGTLSLVVLFFLIISSDDVVEMLLNFAALEFVSQLDEAFFFLSLQGFLGVSCEQSSLVVVETTYFSRENSHQQLRKILFMFTFYLALLSGWIYVTVKQQNGAYQCSTILVQFDDDIRPELGSFSGLYDLNANRMALFSKQRVNYAERRSNGKAKFGYCPDINAWTFSLEQTMDSNTTMNGNAGGFNPCNWIARSTQTDTFDLAQTIASTWYVQDENGREVILHPFYLSCYECATTENECNGRGACSNAICRCDGGWFGTRCEFARPCARLGTDKRYDESFKSARPWSNELELLLDGEDDGRPVVVYNRPIYVNQTQNGDFDVIFFTGRRWAATAASLLFDFVTQTGSQDQVKQQLANYFHDHFHSHWSRFELEFLTEPVDWGTDNDFSSPVNLRWGNARAKANDTMSIQSADSAVPVNTIFLCSFCDEINRCRYNGVCENEGRCQCSPGSKGALCEDPPTGNGHCDPYFNTPAWANDGGDCCESTCRSTSSFICGAEEAGFINAGYFHCKSASSEWHSHDISDLLSDSGIMSVASVVALSFSANIFAVQPDNFNQVDVFDKVGEGWNWRSFVSPANATGNTFQKVAVLEKAGVVWNPLLPIPAKVFVYDTDGTYGTVYLFLCGLFWCDEDPILTYEGARGFDVSANDVVAVVNSGNQVEIYESVSFESGGYISRSNFSVYSAGIPPAYKGIIEISDDASAFALVHISGDAQRNFVLSASIVAFDGSDCVQRGNSINLHTTNNTESLTVNVAIADRGTIFAAVYCEVDSPALVKIYDWNQTEWAARQTPFVIDDNVCKTTGQLGLDMSADGRVVTLLAHGKVLSRAWSGQGWEPIGEPVRAETFSLSGDGYSLAVGDAAGVGDVGGPRQTIVFSRPKPSLCKDSAVLFRLSLTASDTSEFGLGWVLTNNETQEMLRIGNGGMALETTVAEECLDSIADDCFSLFLFGFGDQDGIGEWPASYGVVLNGERLPTDPFDHGGWMKVNFGSCSAVNSTSTKNVCTSGTSSLLEVVAVLQDNPENLAWRLLDHSNNEVILEGGPYGHLNGSVVEQKACLDFRGRCFFFEVENGYPGGYLNPDIFIVGLYLDGIGQSSSQGRDYTQGRVYLGYNECCPEGSSRTQVKISSCGGAEWVLSTLDGTILAEGVSDGGADAADCQDYWHYLCVDYEVTCMVLTYSAGYSNATAEIYASDYNAMIYGYQPSESVLMGNCTHFSSPGQPTILLEGIPLSNQSSTYYFQEYRLEGVESGDIFECRLDGYDLNVSLAAELGDVDDPVKGGDCWGEASCLTLPPATPSDTILSVSVEAIEPYTNMTITCSIWTPAAPIYLSDGVPLGNQSLSLGIQEYRLEGIPMGSTVTCRLDGPYDFESDADLYADYTGNFSNFVTIPCRSENTLSTEMCKLPPAPYDNATLFAFVNAWLPYSDVTIMCSISVR